MSNPIQLDATAFRRSGTAMPPFAEPLQSPSNQAPEWQTDQQFVAMLNAYRSSGGLARAQQVAARFRQHSLIAVNHLAEWIVKRHVISLEWAGKISMPLFQFNPGSMTLLPGLSQALSELVTVYDDWEVAHWFSQPNPWLADCAPADRMAAGAPGVLDAARAARFVVTG
ncbi:MAG: hypothetical protein IPN53_24290 [Comamonadaceae bacterium]|nr:hypothetical protein [Comamonadaceae bacterium]